MLKAMRKGAHGFLAKLLMGFLILTFALWGVGDMFRGAPENVIATVAGEPITAEELSASIRAQQAYVPELTAEVANSLPVRLQFLQRIINSRLLAAEAQALNLSFSEDALSDKIAADPSFHDGEGRFNRDIFLSILRQNNLSQGMFVQRFGTDMKIALLHQAITGATQVPDSLAQLYYHVQNESREAKLLLLGSKDIKAPESPSEEELRALYDQFGDQFREPEFRSYRYVYFNADMIAKTIQDDISEDDARAYYDDNKSEFTGDNGEPATFDASKEQISRLLAEQQMTDNLIALSNQLDDSLAGGATLEEALDTADLSQLKIETLGPISAARALANGELYDMNSVEEEMLQTAFNQDDGEISPITISADHHYFIVETLSVTPSAIPEFESVKADLANMALAEKKQTAVALKAEALAAELQSAENPLAAARERGLPLYDSGAMTRNSVSLKNASKLRTLKLNTNFFSAAFALRPNEVSDAIKLPDNKAAIVIMQKINPAEKPDDSAIASIRAQLMQQMQNDQFEAYLSSLRLKHGVELMMDKIVQTSGGVES